MEQHFNQEDDFELFLKETTENFKMYPSRKIWYSLYNDLHPAKKWPSLAVSLFLIAVMLYLGVSNNNNIYKQNDSQQKIASIIADHYFQDIPTYTFPKQLKMVAVARNKKANIDLLTAPPANFESNELIVISSQDGTIVPSIAPAPTVTPTYLQSEPTVVINSEVITKLALVNSPSSIYIEPNTNNSTVSNASTEGLNEKNKIEITPSHKTNTLNLSIENNTLDSKGWIENYAFENKRSRSNFKRNSSIQYYITPSVGFRWLVKKNDINVVNASTQAIVNVGQPQENIDINDQVTQRFATNFEAGVALNYSVSSRIRFKYGLQFNYTNYIISATELPHSTQTQIAVFNNNTNSYSQIDRSSSFVNTVNSNKTSLNNSTTQIAVPIGADYKLAGRGRLKWYAGATVQPTFILGGSTFAISADVKNYIQEETLLNRLNVNAGLETFVTYRTGNGVTLNLGPQVRYQLLSSYAKEYNYSEKLYNFGVKIGVSKSF